MLRIKCKLWFDVLFVWCGLKPGRELWIVLFISTDTQPQKSSVNFVASSGVE